MRAAPSFSTRSARAALDIGALHGRAISIDERGKVLSYKMTSQCASGSGQFLENIARYLGIAQEEIGSLSEQADNPGEGVSASAPCWRRPTSSTWCRAASPRPNILKGIHLSMAARLSKLLKIDRRDRGVVMVTGGLALDKGLVAALEEEIAHIKEMNGADAEPSGFDLCRRDRRGVVGRVPVRQTRAPQATRTRPETGMREQKEITTWH